MMHVTRAVTMLAAFASISVGLWGATAADDPIRGRDAPPDYGRVFAADSVGRLDLRIAAGDWQQVMNDMTDIAGPFGEGGPRGGGPGGGGPGNGGAGGNQPDGADPAAASACNGRLQGDACAFGNPPTGGVCALTPNGGPLVCQPMRGGNPGGGNQPGGDVDPGELLSRNPIYVPVEVRFEDEIFSNSGFRLKGNAGLTSTWRQGKEKLPFRLNFDAMEDRFPQTRDQTFFGFPNLTFNNGAQDNSYLRNKIVTDLFREAGLPAAQTSFVRVFLDRGNGSTYLGLYTMIEIPDRPFLEHFFDSDNGNLYKPSGTGARWTIFDREDFSKRTNEEDEDWTDIQDAIAALHASRSDQARWRFSLEARFDVDGFLRWLALNTIVGNSDAYGGLAHNYYLYGSPRHRDRLSWIPWDHDLSLRSGGGMMGGGNRGGGPGGGGPGTGPDATIDLFHERTGADWPLIRFLMDDPAYRSRYRQHVEDLLATVFVPSRVNATIRSEYARIARYVVGGEGEDPARGFVMSSQQFDDAVYGANGLLATVENQAAGVRRALETAR